MKKNAINLLLIAFVMMSCEKTQDPIKTIEELKSVTFNTESSKEIASVRTGNVVLDPTTGQNKYEYLTTVQSQYAITPLSVVAETMSEVIYPGSIVRGDSFMNGKYDPLVLKNEFAPITLSISLRGDINVSTTTKPILSQVRLVMTDLITRQKDRINFDFVTTAFSYESDRVTTEEHFKSILKIHAEANVLKGMVKASFGYDGNSSASTSKQYVMVAFRQHIYNVSVNPNHYSNWIIGNVETNAMGEYEPLYISSVDYGRVGYVFVETNKSAEEVSKMIKASLEVAVQYIDANANLQYTKELQSLFTQQKVKVKISGGPVELANKVDSYDSFVKFVQMPNAENITKTSVPISYKVRRLKDNTEVQVLDTYTHNIVQLKSE